MDPKHEHLMKKSDIRGFLAVFRDWAAIILMAYVSIMIDNALFYLTAVWVIGSFQFALGEALTHEASHGNLFQTKRMNTLLEPLFAWPFFTSVGQYRAHHLEHHSQLGTEEDNIKITYEVHGLNDPKRNVPWLWFWRPLSGLAGWSYFRSILSLNSFKRELRIPLFWSLIFIAFGFFNALHVLFLYWIVPLFWSFSSFLYWSEISDHFNAKSGTRTRTGLLSNIVHHNNGYHAVHHENPSIPWFNLKRAHEELSPKGDISRGFIDTFRQLKTSI